MPKEIRISASLIKDYFICPRRVFFRLAGTPQIQTQDMEVGIIVHSVVENYWNNDVLAFHYADAMGASLSPDSRDKTKRCLDNFFRFFNKFIRKDDIIEYQFRLPIGDAFLVGKIDRIGINDSGGLSYLIDWKTSSSGPKKSIQLDPQFIIYNYAVRKNFGTTPPSYLINLYTATMASFTQEDDKEAVLFEQVIPSVVSNIKSNNLPPTGKLTNKCYMCPYAATCLRKE